MNNYEIKKTYYNDISVKDTWSNFKIKNASWIWIRYFLLGIFGFFFKMIVRGNRATRDPQTGKPITKYVFLVWGSVILILASIIIVAIFASMAAKAAIREPGLHAIWFPPSNGVSIPGDIIEKIIGVLIK